MKSERKPYRSGQSIILCTALGALLGLLVGKFALGLIFGFFVGVMVDSVKRKASKAGHEGPPDREPGA